MCQFLMAWNINSLAKDFVKLELLLKAINMLPDFEAIIFVLNQTYCHVRHAKIPFLGVHQPLHSYRVTAFLLLL